MHFYRQSKSCHGTNDGACATCPGTLENVQYSHNSAGYSLRLSISSAGTLQPRSLHRQLVTVEVFKPKLRMVVSVDAFRKVSIYCKAVAATWPSRHVGHVRLELSCECLEKTITGGSACLYCIEHRGMQLHPWLHYETCGFV
jgi:hypothetical protein